MIDSVSTALHRRAAVFRASLVLSLLLLAACEVSPATRPLPDPTPRIQQPSLRPRANTTAPTTTPNVTPVPMAESRPVADAPAFVQVAVGENHSCALQDSGRVQCWGANDDGQLDAPEGASFRQITAGYRFTCGLRIDGSITCWGQNDHGQLDAPIGQFTAIDAGWDHVCALGGGTATCWGWNANARATPPNDVEFTAIGAGAEHSCGLSVSGNLVCWGKNDLGQADSRSGPFSALDVGLAHTCVLRSDGTPLCQGSNRAGQNDSPAIALKQISAGSEHTCGILPQGTLECWGATNNQGINVQLSAPEGTFTSLDAGWHITCGTTVLGSVQCWVPSYVATPYPPYDHLQFVEAFQGRTLSKPTEIFAWPYGGLAVADREGFIRIHTDHSPAREIFNMTDIIASDGSLNGLLSAAIDPDFEESPFLYIYYTIRSDTEVGPYGKGKESARLSRFEVEKGQINPTNELIMMEFQVNPRPTEGYDGANHYGGAIRFGLDGMLYLGIGDSTCFECPQRLDSLHGKIIRIDVRRASTEHPYRIPNDNPMLEVAGARPEIFAYGLRNPWRMAFDRQDGSLYVADVGHDLEEEVSIATTGSNLGWPIYEGFSCLDFTDEVSRFYGVPGGYPCKNESEEMTAPVATYEIKNENCAIIGGVVYRGSEISILDGVYLLGDFCSGRVWVVDMDAKKKWRLIQVADLDFPVSSFGTDAAGEVYVLTFGGPVFRLSETDHKSRLPSGEVVTETITPTLKGSP